jgi:hypothetical protein
LEGARVLKRYLIIVAHKCLKFEPRNQKLRFWNLSFKKVMGFCKFLFLGVEVWLLEFWNLVMSLLKLSQNFKIKPLFSNHNDDKIVFYSSLVVSSNHLTFDITLFGTFGIPINLSFNLVHVSDFNIMKLALTKPHKNCDTIQQ